VLAFSVVVPFIEIPVDKSVVFLPQQLNTATLAIAPTPRDMVAIQPELAPSADSPSLLPIFLYGYLAISLLVGMRLLYQIGFLYSLLLTGKRQLYNNYTLICTDGKLPTSSFFGWIFWDSTQVLNPEEKELMISHEWVHIDQHHSRDMLFVQLLKIVFWFNPVIYLFEKTLQEVHEYLADTEVVRSGNVQTYTHLLISQTLACHKNELIHSFNGSLTHKRIAVIHANRKLAHQPFWKIILSTGLVVGITYIQACQPKESVESGPVKKIDPESTYWLYSTGVVEGSNRFEEGEYLYGHYPKPEVDEYAYPIGGFNPFHKYIQNNLREPYQIKPAGMVKKVFVQFTVDTEGNVRNPRILPGKGLGPEYNKEAIRVIADSPKWVPAKKDGKPVEASMMEVVTFGQNQKHPSLAGIITTYQAGSPKPVEGISSINFPYTYPEEARKQLIEGMVVVGFTVQSDGKASDFKVLQPIHPVLDKEALRSAQAANVPWKPAMKNGKAITSTVLLSFGFYLAD
jgi:TonB family protein